MKISMSRVSLCVVLVGACLVPAADAFGLDATGCARLTAVVIPDVRISSATLVAAAGAAPEHCRVDGRIEAEIGFSLRLPTNWNGKFYHQGVGGFAGSIPVALGALARGYATVSTDTGHQGNGGDGSWALGRADRQVNFGHRAVHLVTVVAKRLVETAYLARPRYSYFEGCSNGGRQALMEAQRYPDDFDGIIAGAPALDWSGIMLGFNWNQQAVKAAPIPPAKLSLIAKAAAEQCDAGDGFDDGLIADPPRCQFDVKKLACSGPDRADCLTAEQITTYEKVIAGPRNAKGQQLHPGFLPGAEDGLSGWQGWITGPGNPAPPASGAPAQFMFQDQFFRFFLFSNPGYNSMTFDINRDAAIVESTDPVFAAVDPNLRAFQSRGGRLILWHGWADHALTATRTVEYYDEVVRTMGGRDNVDGFLRLFMAPGVHHCSGGPGPNTMDMLSALEEWVERGVAPGQVVASNNGTTGVKRSRPLCPYPQLARYVGSGDVNDAKNFACRAPQ